MKVAYVIYKTATGEITQWGIEDESMLPSYETTGHAVLAGEGTAFTHRVVDGSLVAYTAEQAAALKARPTYKARWDVPTATWIDLRDLGEQKADQWTSIKKARDTQEFGGFVWDGSGFDSDPLSQQRITGAALLASMDSSFSIDWTLSDNAVRTLNHTQMISVGQALSVHVETCHAKGRSLRAQIEAATTAAEVAAISW